MNTSTTCQRRPLPNRSSISQPFGYRSRTHLITSNWLQIGYIIIIRSLSVKDFHHGQGSLVINFDADLVLEDVDADVPQPFGELHILGLVGLVSELTNPSTMRSVSTSRRILGSCRAHRVIGLGEVSSLVLLHGRFVALDLVRRSGPQGALCSLFG